MRKYFCWLLILFTISSGLYATTVERCKHTCCVPFGKVLGMNRGVIAYSNCNNDTESDRWHTLSLGKKTLKTGMKWQCVEYARRWLITQKNITFSSIDHAYQIWDLSNAQNPISKENHPWSKYANGKTKNSPKVGDLLIYNKEQGVHGHVSVIVQVRKNKVYLAEQNYSNKRWKKNSFARKLPLKQDKAGFYTLVDKGVIGWMRAQ